jgi:calcium permeable stress-gated cation channel
MPLQLLNLGVVLPRILFLPFTRTPRDFAELNAPPMINYGAVYPQALLVFVITVIYSVIQPFILVFGALYFGIGYVVYKYKLLFGMSNLRCVFIKLIYSQSSTNHTNRMAKRGPSPSPG